MWCAGLPIGDNGWETDIYRIRRNFRIFRKSQAIFENIISKYFGARFQNGNVEVPQHFDEKIFENIFLKS